MYTILDIETTGLSTNYDEILEVGYIRINKNRQNPKKFDICGSGTINFYRPSWKIETPAQKVHKLSRSYLESLNIDMEKSLASLYSVVYDCILIGKNSSSFDAPFIQTFLNRHCNELQPVKLVGQVDIQDKFQYLYRDWMAKRGQATNKKGNLMDYLNIMGMSEEESLKLFLQYFPGNERAMYHSALYDAFVTYLCTIYLVENDLLRL